MLRIGLDINHVLRDINAAFVRAYDKEFATDHLNTMDAKVRENMDIFGKLKDFPFKDRNAKRRFFEEDYHYEIFASAVHSEAMLIGRFSQWRRDVIDYADEDVELIFFSVGETELQYSSTLFFLSKGLRPKHIVFVDTPEEIWDICDAVVTANKKVLEACPENKVSFKIERDFNKDAEADYTYERIGEIMEDKDFLNKAMTKTENTHRLSWTRKIRRFLKG